MSLQALKNIRNTNNNTAKSEQQQGFPAMLEQFKGEITVSAPQTANLLVVVDFRKMHTSITDEVKYDS